MAVSLHHQSARGYGGEPRCTYFSFAPNGAATPVAANTFGPPGVRAPTIINFGAGQYGIEFHRDFGPPANSTFILSAQCQSLATAFEVVQIGAYNASTRVLVVQCKQALAGFAPPAHPSNRVHIGIFFNDSTGG